MVEGGLGANIHMLWSCGKEFGQYGVPCARLGRQTAIV